MLDCDYSDKDSNHPRESSEMVDARELLSRFYYLLLHEDMTIRAAYDIPINVVSRTRDDGEEEVIQDTAGPYCPSTIIYHSPSSASYVEGLLINPRDSFYIKPKIHHDCLNKERISLKSMIDGCKELGIGALNSWIRNAEKIYEITGHFLEENTSGD
ncbi:MAG: hypothetical protein V1870_02215 [Candidatus Aenigmatarchaeota archaeon]